MKKSGGLNISIITFMFFIITTILTMMGLEIYMYNVKAESTQNDIVLSNLAVYKDIDLKELGNMPSYLILKDPYTTLNTFKVYIQKNMLLNSSMVALSNSYAKGEVKVKEYIIYNVKDKEVDIYTYDRNTNLFTEIINTDRTLNPVYTPNGKLIENTTIHTTLQFNIENLLKGIIGDTSTVDVTADTDIRK